MYNLMFMVRGSCTHGLSLYVCVYVQRCLVRSCFYVDDIRSGLKGCHVVIMPFKDV